MDREVMLDSLNDDFLQIGRELQMRHQIFNKFWFLGRPVVSNEIETMKIEFDTSGKFINFLINPSYWKSRDLEQHIFDISHLCLHLLLLHGLRTSSIEEEDKELADQAIDLIVNHSLIEEFYFNREEVDPEDRLCWTDRVFPPDVKVPNPSYFEEYFQLLKGLKDQPSPQQEGATSEGTDGGSPEKKGKRSAPQLLDDHSGLEAAASPEFEQFIQENFTQSELMEVESKISPHLKDEDLNSAAQQAGINPGNMVKTINKVKPIRKKKWETIIKRWSSRYESHREEDQWILKNRRYSCLSEDLILPTQGEVEELNRDRIRVWFFLDTSGSCSHLGERFFRAAESLDPKRFDIRLFCFDTRVYETSLKSRKLYGFGGTLFSIIEQYIQNKIKEEDVPYPKAVFCITDGFGDRVYPKEPDRWYWFLTEQYKECIPKECNTFNLKDFE